MKMPLQAPVFVSWFFQLLLDVPDGVIVVSIVAERGRETKILHHIPRRSPGCCTAILVLFLEFRWVVEQGSEAPYVGVPVQVHHVASGPGGNISSNLLHSRFQAVSGPSDQWPSLYTP